MDIFSSVLKFVDKKNQQVCKWWEFTFFFYFISFRTWEKFEMVKWNNENIIFFYKIWIYIQCNFFFLIKFHLFVVDLFFLDWLPLIIVIVGVLLSLLAEIICVVDLSCDPALAARLLFLLIFFSQWHSVREFCQYTAVVQVVSKRYACVSAELIFLKVME